VEYLKHGEEKNFAIVDAAMNDLMRPALYDAFHDILPISREYHPAAPLPNPPPVGEGAIVKSNVSIYEVVGPICETGDFLGHARQLAIAEGDLLAIMSAGAYGMSMSSNYNTRPRAAEVMVSGQVVQLIRERETVPQLFTSEKTFL
ncbi:MAG: diaminopimelate decarboxylase, partial [Gallionellaceae bacterium]|nr:diaminopimelate decarboxylase [Gallionellaceae bacterium]